MGNTELESLEELNDVCDELDEVMIAERLFKERIAEALADISSVESLLEEMEKEYEAAEKKLKLSA